MSDSLKGLKPTRSVRSMTQIEPTSKLNKVAPSSPVQGTEATAPVQGAEDLILEQVDRVSHERLSELINAVDRGERPHDEAWEETLLLALTTSLNVPKPVALSLLPRLKALIDTDPDAGRALRERLKGPPP